MPSPTPTLVLIHGAWHTPNHYSKLSLILRAAGFEVHVPALLSTNGSRPPNADMFTDSSLIHNYVESLVDAGRIVVAIMHSYGGQVGTNALQGLDVKSRERDGLPGGVGHLLYFCAFANLENVSMGDVMKKFNLEHLVPLAFDFADDMSSTVRDPQKLFIGDYDDEAEVKIYVRSLVRWNATCLWQPISTCAWRDIPVTYVRVVQDCAIPLELQDFFIKNMRQAGAQVKTFTLDTTHLPNLTAATPLAEIIIKVAKS